MEIRKVFFEDGRKWFEEARAGMFIHFGLYIVHELHEQEEWRYGVPHEEYKKLINEFNPTEFDPGDWIDAAKSAGMEYMVLTTKHHDGFCLWDTKETDYNVMNTPFGKDVIKAVADECHKRNFPLVLYYSVADWDHKAYPNVGRSHEIITDPATHDPEAYLAFLKRQMRELCSNYGKIHGIWWDMNVAGFEDPSINEMIRELQPGIIINNRGMSPADYSTPERSWGAVPDKPFTSAVEACECIGMCSWAYRADEDYHSNRKLQRFCALYTAMGGNFLLGASPDHRGIYADKPKAILSEFGKWYKKVRPALTAPPCPGIVKDNNIFCTGGGKELNLILLENAIGETLFLPGLTEVPVKAEIINSGVEVEFTMQPNVYTMKEPPMLRLRKLPCDQMNNEIQVIKLTFAEPVIKAVKFEENVDNSGIVSQG